MQYFGLATQCVRSTSAPPCPPSPQGSKGGSPSGRRCPRKAINISLAIDILTGRPGAVAPPSSLTLLPTCPSTSVKPGQEQYFNLKGIVSFRRSSNIWVGHRTLQFVSRFHAFLLSLISKSSSDSSLYAEPHLLKFGLAFETQVPAASTKNS